MMNFVNPGDPITAQAFNMLANSIPNIKQLAPNMGFIAGSDGTLVMNQWNNLMAAPQGGEGSLRPFKVRWMSHSKEVDTAGEWQIYLPTGCVTINNEPVVPTNVPATDIEGNKIIDWYKIEDPTDSDGDVGTYGKYEIVEWHVYVHVKSFPLMYVSTKKDDSTFTGTLNDLYVANMMRKEWEEQEGEANKKHTQHLATQVLFDAQHLDFEKTGSFRLEWKCEGNDKRKPSSYKLYIVNQYVQFGRVQVWGQDKTDITNFTEVFVKIDHSTKEANIEVVAESQANSMDYTFIKIMKIVEGSIKEDYRETIRKELQLYNN